MITKMDDDLMEAARGGDIDALYKIIKSKPNILDGMDEQLFVETPLHVAASAGHTFFALEIIRLKPSFGKMLNPDGLSPLHLAVQNKQPETVKRLINFDRKLIRVKGRESLTPLHFVVKTDDQVNILSEFLRVCPPSIYDLTIRDETALHIAVKSSSLEAVKVLLGWLRKTFKGKVLCSKDVEGNTVLHSAVSCYKEAVQCLKDEEGGSTEVLRSKETEGNMGLHSPVPDSKFKIVELLLKEIYTDKKAKNSMGLTALDIAETLDDGPAKTKIVDILPRPGAASKGPPVVNDCSDLAEFLKSPQQWLEAIVGFMIYEQNQLSMDMRNVILVVAVLIATATFQGILQPPGGVMRDTDTDPSPTNTTPNIINGTIFSSATNTKTTNFIPTNITHFNATILTTTADTNTDNPAEKKLFKMKSMTYGSFFLDFYTMNTICFLTSITAMIFVLPVRLSSVMLHISLLFLIVTYGISFYVIAPSYSYASRFFLASYIAFPCVYSVWISVSIISSFPKIKQYRYVPHKLWNRLQKLRDLYNRSIEGSAT